MGKRHSRLLVGLTALFLVLGLAGCGVSATDRPVDEGDAAVGGAPNDPAPQTPPGPNVATTPTDLVSNFLQAAAGGLAGANDRVKAYLTGTALDTWQDPVNPDNPSLTVVRIVGNGPPGIPIAGRTPVTLDYQVVGTLNDLGRIDELAPPETRQLVFWIVPDAADPANSRIDEIDGDGWKGLLLLSDAALTRYYQPQPIYFWDNGNKLLVPDLRYVPQTVPPDQRANKKVDWLLNGASPWLSGRVQRVSGTKTEAVVSQDDGALEVSLSADAGSAGADAVRRLMFQLQWSLADGSATARIDLRIGDKPAPVTVGPGEFRQYNHSYAYFGTVPTRYDITKDQVVVDGSGNPLPLLGTGNTDVVSAAIDDQSGVAAVVRTDEFGRYVLQIARTGQQALLGTDVVSVHELGRPSFVPGTSLVLVPTGGPNGRLLAVSTVDGKAKDVTPTPTGVTAAAVSPDGRRVAVVADGGVYIASFTIEVDGTLSIGSAPRQVLGGLLRASSVTWTAEWRLLVAGTHIDDGSVALWKVTDDGVLAEDVSGAAGGFPVSDLVSYPQWSANQSSVDALAVTPEGVYAFRGSAFSPVANLNKPFYGSLTAVPGS